jgi:hypothetical protein
MLSPMPAKLRLSSCLQVGGDANSFNINSD